MSDNTKSDCLPSKPSELIRVALADLRKCEKDKRYGIDMSDWHVPVDDDDPDEPACYVCLAGAVMAKSLGVPIGESKSCGSYYLGAPLVSDQLDALDEFRKGCVSDALGELGISSPHRTMPIPAYERGAEDFHEAMAGMADMLESEGL